MTSYERSDPPQGGAPIDEIGGNEESSQAIMSLLISDCGGSSLWFQAILFSSCPSCSSWFYLLSVDICESPKATRVPSKACTRLCLSAWVCG